MAARRCSLDWSRTPTLTTFLDCYGAFIANCAAVLSPRAKFAILMGAAVIVWYHDWRLGSVIGPSFGRAAGRPDADAWVEAAGLFRKVGEPYVVAYAEFAQAKLFAWPSLVSSSNANSSTGSDLAPYGRRARNRGIARPT